MIRFRQSRTRHLINRVRQLRHTLLDALYSPVISRLTFEEYYGSRTRNDCLRAFLSRKLAI